MGGVFNPPDPPQPPAPDPELIRMRREEQERLDKEKADLEARILEEKEARKRRLRGRASLLTAGSVGYPDDEVLKETLGG